MGLDIGAVQIEYMDRPNGAAYRFAWHLAGHWDDESWQVFSGENVFTEYGYDHLVRVANDYILSARLGDTQAYDVLTWVRGLPWRNGTVMRHLGW